MRRRRRSSVPLVAGVVLTAALVLVALVSLAWTPYAPDAVRVVARLRPPGADHWLGTDHFGRDVLSLVLVGARLARGFAAAAVGRGLLGGVPLGLLGAARPGWWDEAAGRAADLLFAFPAVLVAVLLTALNGPGAGNAVAAIALFNVAVLARVTQGAARGVMRRDFVRASVALGRGPWGVAVVHVLPAIAGVLAVQATVLFAAAILSEAGLSYLGLGVQPPTPSWGRMLGDAQTFLIRAPRLAVFPGAAIALSVLGLSLLGDGLRDRFDPRHESEPIL